MTQGLEEQELLQHGYTIGPGRLAKHPELIRFLYLCTGCNRWFRQLHAVSGDLRCDECREARKEVEKE